MASQKMIFAFFMVGLAIVSKKFSATAAPAPAPASPDIVTLCSNVIANMFDCLDYLSEDSSTEEPGEKCCMGTGSVLEFNPHCICVALETSSSLGYTVNMTRADSLASLCLLKPYPLDKCDIPNQSPQPSPVGPPEPDTPTPSPEPETPTPSPEPGAPTPSPEPGAPSPAPEPDTPTPASAPTPGVNPPMPTCDDIIYNMIDCVGFISKDSKEDKPEPSCCPGIEAVIDFSKDCVCEAMKSTSQLGIELNMTRVQKLPSICGIQDDPTGDCKIVPSSIPPTPSANSNTPKPAPKSSASRTLGGASLAAAVCSFAVLAYLVI